MTGGTLARPAMGRGVLPRMAIRSAFPPAFTTDEVLMRPVTGGHPAVEFPTGGMQGPAALAAQLRRRGLLLRLLAAVVAVLVLLLLWSPAVVRA